MPDRFFTSLIFSLLSMSLLFISSTTFAGPIVRLCLQNDCRNTQNIAINDATWSTIRALYNTPFKTDAEEQLCIISAISLIEQDVFQTASLKPDGVNSNTNPGNSNSDNSNPDNSNLDKPQTSKQSAKDLRSTNNKKTSLKNIKTYLGVLLDNHLINRHYLRNTITLTNTWTRFESDALLLQSLTDSRLYTLQIKQNKLGAAPVITPYKSE